MSRHKRSKKEIISEVKRIYRDNGPKALSYNVMVANKKTSPIIWAAVKDYAFGTWKNAVEAAGIDYDEITMVKRYNINHNFFSRDTVNGFYCAGLIMADGTLYDNSEKNKKIKIGLARRDRSLLIKLKHMFNYTGPLYDYEHLDNRSNKIYRGSELAFHSVQIFNDLGNKFDIFPKKTMTCEFPERIVFSNLVSHFIRGYCDGDGSWFSTERSPNRLFFSVVGTKQFLAGLRDVLRIHCGTRKNQTIAKNKSVFQISYSSIEDVIKIRNFIYSNSTKDCRLGRKYSKSFGDWENRWKLDLRKNKKYFTGGKVIRPIVATNIVTNEIITFDCIADTQNSGFSRVCAGNCCNKRQESHKNYMFRYATEEDIEQYWN